MERYSATRMGRSRLTKQTFEEFKDEWAEDWAEDDVNNIWETKDFVIDVLKDYYLKDLPNNKKDFFNYLAYEKGYGEEDAEDYLSEVSDE